MIRRTQRDSISGSHPVWRPVLGFGVALLSSLCLAGVALGQVPEWQVNTVVVGVQAGADIVELPGGDLVLFWGSQNIDGSGSGVVMRRFQADGTPIDAVERVVNVFTTDNQAGPKVAIDAGGEMVVVWSGNSATDSSSIVARRVAADGTLLGDDIKIDTQLSGFQQGPRVARSPGGGFAVIWFDSVPDQVFARRFAADGTPLEEPFGVSRAGLPGNSGGQDVAYASNGDLLVAWGDDDQIFVQRYDAVGGALGMPVLVSLPIVTNIQPRLATASDGTSLVVWRGFEIGNQNLITGQRLDAADQLLGSNLVFNTLLQRSKASPTVVREADGGHRVVWLHQGTAQGSGFDLYSRRIDASGQLVGAGEVLGTTTTLGDQQSPNLVALAAGGSLLVWTGPDQDSFGVFTDMPTTEPLFTDDFESGDTTRWYQTNE